MLPNLLGSLSRPHYFNFNQFCRAGAAKSRIFWPEPYRDAAPAPMAPALKVLFNIGSFQKMTQT
jgi:hypothetical protein